MSVTLDLNHADQGLIKDQGRSYAVEDGAKSRDLNRFQKDLALLSHVVHRFGLGIHYPHIETADNKMTGSAIADKVILDPGIWVMIGGVPVNTSAIAELDRTFNIPDSSTRFLRLSLGANCGQATLNDPAEPNNPDWVVTRDHVFDFSLVTGTEDDPEGTGGGPSSPTSMRIFKAVKGGAGGVPEVTWYVNNAHAAAQTYFDNGVADLPGAPNDVQSAIEALTSVKSQLVWLGYEVSLVVGGVSQFPTWATVSVPNLPSGTKAVLIDTSIGGPSDHRFAYLRKKGGSEHMNLGNITTSVLHACRDFAIVGVDSSGEFQYSTINNNVTVDINTFGYFV